MAAPQSILSYGTTELFLAAPPEVEERADGFDEGSFVFEGPVSAAASLGQNTVVPGYSGLTVMSNRRIYDGDCVVHHIRAIGIYYGSPTRVIETEAVDQETGPDTGTATIIVPRNSSGGISYGTAHEGYANLRAVSIARKRSPVESHEILRVAYKGIKSATRGRQVSFSTIGRSARRENFIWNVAGGDTVARNWEINFGRPAMNVSYLTTQIPDFNNFPRQQSQRPPEFPVITSTVSVSVDPTSITYHWPNGYVLLGYEAEQLVNGHQLWWVREFWTHQDRASI